ncbi:hypothetical protein [Kitasatospora sp. NPDC057015]|uniref:hypothetical protein n=1 Tax=Kitasatospora sp. NPDC057015 TaxID=3346001 RepID=UPI003638272A
MPESLPLSEDLITPPCELDAARRVLIVRTDRIQAERRLAFPDLGQNVGRHSRPEDLRARRANQRGAVTAAAWVGRHHGVLAQALEGGPGCATRRASCEAAVAAAVVREGADA